MSPEFPAGTAARYNPAASIKRVEWDFGGDSVRKENVVRKFDTSGEVAVTLTVTDVNDEVCSGTFTVRVRE
ncbi:MAG TPA: PKD domain-containing protein [Candidatus Hydrogenedentes bacterium]|nr:PKD domain-containing protein [Candidatus Hydrogenedentota bacterium]